MPRAPRSPHRGAAVLVLLFGLLLGMLPNASAQTDSSTSASAVLTQDGWWNRAKGPQPNEPANPLRTNIGGSIPAPSTVPENGLGVGAVNGDPDKVAAIGLILEAPPGALVDRLVLTLQETTGNNGSQINSASAKINACPITSFWAGVKNGDFVSRPACDDSQAVPGRRAADGTWTFDLNLLAAAWLDPESGLQQNGVLLVEAVDAPVSFQTSFADISTGKVTLDFAATDLGLEDFSDVGTFDDAPVGDSFTTADEPALEDVPFDAGSTSFDDTASFATGSTTRAPAVRPVPTAAPTGPPQVATPVARTTVGPGVGLFEALPWPAVVLLVLLLAGAGLFLATVLGPMAAPATVPVRAGGVSRALAARAEADAQAARR